MTAPKYSCPACKVVFDPDQSDGPVICPLCDTRFLPGAAPPPAVALSSPPSAAAPLVPLAELTPAAPVSASRSHLPALVLLALAVIIGGVSLAHWLPSEGSNGPHAAEVQPHAAAVQTATTPDPGPDLSLLPQLVFPKVVQALSSSGPETPPPPRPTPRPPTSSTEPLAERINHAITLGTAYLKDRGRLMHLPCDYQGLLGLTLLECGVSPNDPAIVRIADSLRGQTRDMNKTYNLATTIFFFDRLGRAEDHPRICTLANRLVLGQGDRGTWTYHSPYSNGSKSFTGDHSNTQFAALALWIAQRHGVAVGQALFRLEMHFREVQREDGSWDYGGYSRGTLLTSNTCAGLVGLAVGHGIDAGRGRDARLSVRPSNDRAIRAGLSFLGQSIAGTGPGGRDTLDGMDLAYTLWSIERTAVIYNLRTIGKQEWYPWAAEWFLTLQGDNGSWGVFLGPEVDTCFALLVLRRNNLVPDLTLALQEPTRKVQPLPPVGLSERPGTGGGRVPDATPEGHAGGRVPDAVPEARGGGRTAVDGSGAGSKDERKRTPQ